MIGNWSKGNSYFRFVFWIMKTKLIWYLFVERNSKSKFFREDSFKSTTISSLYDRYTNLHILITILEWSKVVSLWSNMKMKR